MQGVYPHPETFLRLCDGDKAICFSGLRDQMWVAGHCHVTQGCKPLWPLFYFLIWSLSVKDVW